MRSRRPLVLLAVLGGCTAPAPDRPAPAPPAAMREFDANAPIEVAPGESFVLRMKGNVTTGYHWEIAERPDSAVAVFVAQDYVPDQPMIPGSGGVARFTFRAVAAGRTTIGLGHYPPGGDTPAQTMRWTVTVR